MQLGQLPPKSRPRPAPEYPQIKINHAMGEFGVPVDSIGMHPLGKSITVIALGLLRSRAWWTDDHDSRKGLKCQSSDSIVGQPNWGLFPWDESPWTKVPSNTRISCEVCPFKGYVDRKPQCAQTWTLPVIVPDAKVNNFDPALFRDGQVYLMPFSASSIKNLKEYLTPFRDNEENVYNVYTDIKLSKQSSGNNTYSVAKFSEVGKTSEEHHLWYSDKLLAVREALQPSDTASVKGFQTLPIGG